MIRIFAAIALAAAYLLLAFAPAKAESTEADKKTATYLTMIADGRLQEVKAKLPDLMVERPNDPGVQLLLAVVIDDAFKALDIYKKITDSYPESEWADDAYWRIVQFYAVMGDTTQAQNELNNFRRRYPTSGYLVPAIDVVRSSVAMTRAQIKPVVEGPLMQPPVDYSAKLQPLSTAAAQKAKSKPAPAPLPTENSADLAKAMNSQNTAASATTGSAPASAKSESHIPDPSPEDEAETPVDETDSMGSAEEEQTGIILLASTESEPPAREKIAETPKSGYYGLQVASFGDEMNAQDSKAKFINQRMRTEILTRESNGSKVYAVVIGNYSSKSSAEAAKIIVGRQCECEPIIVEK